MNVSKITIQIQSLPNEPGVYQYFDKDSNVVYVGKAKNLKKKGFPLISIKTTITIESACW